MTGENRLNEALEEEPERPKGHFVRASKIGTITSMEVWHRLAKSRRRWTQLVERRLRRSALPALIWHDVLLALATTPGGELTSTEIQRRLSIPQYKLWRLIECLVEGEHVVCRRGQARGKPTWLAITQRGRSLQERMAESSLATIEADTAGKLSEAEVAEFTQLLAQLLGQRITSDELTQSSVDRTIERPGFSESAG
ncbi:MarR family winged helix-turn-helix transcriptional regulator [Bradyrhizobium sp. USDA 4454]